MNRALFVTVLALALASCNTTRRPTEPIVQIQRVEVPAPVYCDTNVGPEPDYADSDAKLAAAPDILAAMEARVIGRFQRIARDQVKDAALAACRPPQP